LRIKEQETRVTLQEHHDDDDDDDEILFLISNFRSAANVVFFLLGDSPAPEFRADVAEHSVPSS
jgi:hypothetical protein